MHPPSTFVEAVLLLVMVLLLPRWARMDHPASMQQQQHLNAPAAAIFRHWHQLVQQHQAHSRGQASMQDPRVPILPAACIYLFEYSAQTQTLEFWPRERGQACNMPTAHDRAKTYQVFISSMLLQNPRYASSFTRDFSFLLDVIDGHRQSAAARALPLPLLVLSKHPHDNYTLPFPDLYQVLGLFAADYRETGNDPPGTEALQYNWHGGVVEGRGLSQLGLLYSFQLPVPDWASRRSSAVFRGSCYSTANSSDALPRVRAYVGRAQLARLCAAYRRLSTEAMDTRGASTSGGARGVAGVAEQEGAAQVSGGKRQITDADALHNSGSGSAGKSTPVVTPDNAGAVESAPADSDRALSTGRRRSAAIKTASAVRVSVVAVATTTATTAGAEGEAHHAVTRKEHLAAEAAWGGDGEAASRAEGAMAEALAAAALPPGSLDLGLAIRNYKGTCINNSDAPGLCSACKLCYAESRANMHLSEMLECRYQVLVDGYSASWDSSMSKLSTGSVTFYVLPQRDDGSAYQPWALWWYPALQPGVHYIPTTATELPLRLAECLTAKDGCRSMAEAARTVVTEAASKTSTLDYAHLVLKHVHDLHQD